MDKTTLRAKTSGGTQSWGQKGQFCEIYLQELFQTLTVNNEEKIPLYFWQGEGKRNQSEIPRSFCFS